MLHLSFGRLIRFDEHIFEFALQPPFLNRKRRSHADGAGVIVPLLDADGARMHHEFVLDACVLTGNFNWTKHAGMCNWENLCILRDPVAVSPFARVNLLIRPGLLPFGQRKSTCASGEADRRNSFQSNGAGGVVRSPDSFKGRSRENLLEMIDFRIGH